MNSRIKLTAADHHELSAYVAQPVELPAGAVIVIQEIFGVNASIRSVADSYAEDGFLAIAPALFDRTERNVELTYEGEDMQRAFALMGKLTPDTALQDIAAAFAYARQSTRAVGVVGFCYGGLMSWLSATRGEGYGLRPDCCVGYYAGGIGKVATEQPACPVMLHFGENDTHIGRDQVDAVRSAHPGIEIFLYPEAEHAFANSARPSYREPAASLARTRSLAFLRQHLRQA